MTSNNQSQSSSKEYSLITDGIPFDARPCFNWLPQYRYGLFAYKALQQACAHLIVEKGDALEFIPSGTKKPADIPLQYIRPVLMDSVLSMEGCQGFVTNEAKHCLRKFSSGEFYHPITSEIALIVAKEEGTDQLLNNILSYLTPAPVSIEALLALGGGYSGTTQSDIAAAHIARRNGAQELKSMLCEMYGIQDNALLHICSAGVGGIIEASTRHLFSTKPDFHSCVLVPEYWDLLRCLLTYSPKNLHLVRGLEAKEFPEENWIKTISKPEINFSYISYTNNPLGNTVPRAALLKAIEAINDDALFLIDCTSVDTMESSGTEVIKDLIRRFPHKNLLITKSFSKEYNKGHLRVGYGIFTRRETAESIWPRMTGYPTASTSRYLMQCIRAGNVHVLDAYRRIEKQIRKFAENHKDIHVSGFTSNYTSLFFKSEERASEVLANLQEQYGHKVFPGELPMQGGGDIDLSGGISLTAVKRVPFLAKNALRILVSENSFPLLERCL